MPVLVSGGRHAGDTLLPPPTGCLGPTPQRHATAWHLERRRYTRDRTSRGFPMPEQTRPRSETGRSSPRSRCARPTRNRRNRERTPEHLDCMPRTHTQHSPPRAVSEPCWVLAAAMAEGHRQDGAVMPLGSEPLAERTPFPSRPLQSRRLSRQQYRRSRFRPVGTGLLWQWRPLRPRLRSTPTVARSTAIRAVIRELRLESSVCSPRT